MKKINWGLIGASTIAKEWMVDAINSRPDSQILSIMSSDMGRGKQFADEFNIPHFCNSVDEMLTQEIDAVYISTTNELHHPQAIAVGNSGKHLLCEKPLALTIDQAKEMVELFKENNLVLGTNHHLRNAASHRKIKELVDKGTIGELRAVRIFHAVYLPENLQTWRLQNPEAGGGITLDITVHNVDCLRFITGRNPLAITSSFQNAGMAKNNLQDGIMSIVELEGGAQAFLHESFAFKYAGNGLEVHGSEGSIFGDSIMSPNPVGEVRLSNSEGDKVINLEPENLYHRSVQLFNQAINGEGTPAATGEDGLYSLTVALAAEKSCLEGKKIELNY